MKKLLCYLGILVLFSLGIFPVVLRIALPNKEEEKKVVDEKKVLLACSGDKYITATNYEGEKINMIMIKQITSAANDESDVLDDTKNDLDSIFDSFRTNGDVLYQKVNDGEVLTIDFSVSNHTNLDLSKINNKLETQKEIYEQFGLNCRISD